VYEVGVGMTGNRYDLLLVIATGAKKRAYPNG
jgi:hypothetical protein